MKVCTENITISILSLSLSLARVPKKILKCSQVSREINFSSEQELTNLRLQQNIYFKDKLIEGKIIVLIY